MKLMDKRGVGSGELERIRSGSGEALKEWKRLEQEKLALFQKIHDPTTKDSDKYRSRITLLDPPANEVLEITGRTSVELKLRIANQGIAAWPLGIEQSVRVGFAWFKKGAKPPLLIQRIKEERCELPFVLRGGDTADFVCQMPVNVQPGAYEVWIGLVHDGVTWFLEKGDEFLKLDVTVQ